MKYKAFKMILKFIITGIGLVGGYLIANGVTGFLDSTFSISKQAFGSVLLLFLFPLLVGTFAFLWFDKLNFAILKLIEKSERFLDKFFAFQLLGSVFGLILGLIIALIISQLFQFLNNALLSFFLSSICYIIFSSIGFTFGYKRSEELASLFRLNDISRTTAKDHTKIKKSDIRNKVIDTSVIIDGRIVDIARAGFLEGKLVITKSVLLELQHIADSDEPSRKSKGRRGLDIVTKLREELQGRVIFDDTEYEGIHEVDTKLLKLAKETGSAIVTNDYNLNKLAKIEDIPVLNINDLTIAMKPMFMQNEEIEVLLVKEGKEVGQGIAYMNDGTMVIVDNSSHHIGKTVKAVVTSILQSSTGRIIFAKLQSN